MIELSIESNEYRSAAWSKFIATKLMLLNGFKYVICIDTDMVITSHYNNYFIKNILLKYLNFNNNIKQYDCVLSSGRYDRKHKINAGIWIMRNTNWTLNFIDILWNSRIYFDYFIDNDFTFGEQKAFYIYRFVTQQ